MRAYRSLILSVMLTTLVGTTAIVYVAAFHRTEGNYFDSNGARIYYTDQGEGTPVILLHGFGVHSDLNFRLPSTIHLLAQDYRVIAVDARAHGLSERPSSQSGYGIQMVEDVFRLMDHLDIEKAHWVGYSMGGFTALKAMTMHPERFYTAALCASGWHTRNDPEIAFMDRLSQELAAGDGFDALFDMLTPSTNKRNYFAEYGMAGLMRLINDEKALSYICAGWPELEVAEDALKKNEVPSITLIGEHDPFRRGADALHAVMPHHEIVLIEGRDHYNAVNLEFVRKLKAFLDGYAPAPQVTGAGLTWRIEHG